MCKWRFRKEAIFAERSISLLNSGSLQQIGWAKSLRSNTYRLVTFCLCLAVGLCCSVGARSDDDTDPPQAVPRKATEKQPASPAKTVEEASPAAHLPANHAGEFPKMGQGRG